ncbi:hypothetical protein BH11MYX1_BH11MYX1_00100 [soil metagenome]
MATREGLTQAELDSFGLAWSNNAVLRYLGVRMSFPNGTHVVVELPAVLPQQRGGKGTDAVNGGVLAMMFDFALGATALLAPPLRRNATCQLSIEFMKGVRGDAVRAIGKVDRATRTILFSSAELFDEKGVLCARASGLVSLGEPVTLADWTDSITPYDH